MSVRNPPAGTSKQHSVSALRRELRSRLEHHIEPEYAVRITELVPTSMEMLGVRVPAIRLLAREFVADYPTIDAEKACDLYEHCLKNPCREELLFTQGILERFRRKLDPAMWDRVDTWVDHIENWEVCDQLSKHVVSTLVHKQPSLSVQLTRWVDSSNPWRRRFALATAVALNQGGKSNVQLVLDLCEPLMQEDDPVVQKAIGWALREAAKHDPKRIEVFLLNQQDSALPRIIKDARR